jgi:hypothetical protein
MYQRSLTLKEEVVERLEATMAKEESNQIVTLEFREPFWIE